MRCRFFMFSQIDSLIHSMLLNFSNNPFFDNHRKNQVRLLSVSLGRSDTTIIIIKECARYRSLGEMNIPIGFRTILKQNKVENFYKIYLYFAENGLTLHSEYIG